MRKATFLLLTILLCVYIMPLPVHAQAEPTIIYETEFEDDPGVFGDEYYGNDTYWTGEEWDSDCGVDATGCIYTPANLLSGDDALALIDYAQNPIDVDLTGNPAPPGCVINFVEFDLYYRTDTEGGTDVSEIYVVGDDDGTAGIITPVTPNDYSFRDDFDIAGLPGAVEGEFFHVGLSLSNTEVMDSWAIRWAIVVEDIPGDPPVYDLEVRVDNLVVWCDYEEQWIRPLAAEDEHPQWEMFDRPYAESLGAVFESTNYWVNSFSEGFHLPVHSAVAGTVTYMAPLVASDPICGYGSSLGICVVYIPDVISQDGNIGYKLDLVLAYKVIVSFGDLELTYLVHNAPAYLTLSQEIGAGCVIGETIQLLNQTSFELDSINGDISGGASISGEVAISGSIGATVALRSWLTNNGFVGQLLQDFDDTPQELYSRLTRYPTSDQPCVNNDPRFANCLERDPQLRQASEWTTQGNVTFDDPGFTLISSNALIKEVMALEPDVEYGLTVDFQVIEPEPRVELKLGQTVETSTILEAPGQIVTLSIAADLHAADLTEFWTVRVRNVSGASVKVLSICVSAGEIVGQPTACYFRNDSFDQGVTNWDVSEGVGQRDGSITVPSLDTFAQEATLPADEPDTTFQLYVDVYIWYEPGTTISRTDVTSTVQMEYQFPDSGASWETLVGPSSSSTTTFSEFVVAAERQGVTVGTVSFQGFIEIDADTTGTITIRPTVTTAVEGVLGVGIDRACLRGDFGVDQIDDTIGVECQEVTRPLDQLLSSWTVWLWRKLDRFFQCDLMIVLRQIRNTTTEIYRLTGWSIRYWKAAYFYSVDWAGNSVFPWLNGHFRNIAMGNVAVVYSNSQNGANLFDFLIQFFSGGGTGLFDVLNNIVNSILAPIVNVLLGIIGAVAFVLLEVIVEIVGVAFNLFNTSVNLIGTMFSMFYGLISAWNSATPTAIPGVPMCGTDPQASTFCMLLWAAEHTVFSGVGSLWIPLIIAFGAAKVILWSVREFKKTLVDTGAMM